MQKSHRNALRDGRISRYFCSTYTLEPNLREVGNPIAEKLPDLRKSFKHINSKETLELSPEERKGFKENNELVVTSFTLQGNPINK